MIKSIRSILFATDLTKNCQQALDFTLAMATRFQATIYLLHVIEKLPEHMDEKLKDLLGNHKWEEMVASNKMHARKSLLGKQSTNSAVREAIHNFCNEENIDAAACNLQSHEIIVSDGELVEDILRNAKENDCDLIVIGGPHGSLFSHSSSMGSTAKGLLKNSKIPVTVVPAVGP